MTLNDADILKAKILIVDDQEANVRLLEQLLRKSGYVDVSSTMDSRAVCDMHQAHHYDLILLDLLMPGMDGFAVLEALKAIETDGYVPVLVITAQPAHKVRALQAGAKDFVSKPIDLLEVKTRIHNLLEVRLLYRRLANYNRQLEQTVLERTSELRASEERFRRLMELSSDWHWEQDASGHYTKLSESALEMLGGRGDTSSDAADAGVRWNQAERASLEDYISARRPFLDFVYSRINADGSQQYFQVSGEPIFDNAGSYIGYRGIGIDVSERMRRDSGQ